MKNFKVEETFILNRDFEHIKMLIERANNDDQWALQHLNLYFDNVIKKHINFWSKRLGKHHKDDIESVALWAVYEATCQFDGDSSDMYFDYVNKRIRSKIMNYKRGEAKHLNKFIEFQDNDEYNNCFNSISDNFNYEAHCISKISFRHIFDNLNESEKKLSILLLSKKLSYKEMADELGITYDCLRQRKKSLQEKIEKYIK